MLRQRYTVELLRLVDNDEQLFQVSHNLAERFGRDPKRLMKTLKRKGHLSTPISLEEAEYIVRVCERLGLDVGIAAA